LFDGSDTWVNVGFCFSRRHSAICVEKQKQTSINLECPVMGSFLFSIGLKGNMESFRDANQYIKCHSCFLKEHILTARCNTRNAHPKYKLIYTTLLFLAVGFYINSCFLYNTTPNPPREIY